MIRLIYVSVEEPILPNWIYERGLTDKELLKSWFGRAEIHADIMRIEYLPSNSPWKFQYRSVSCSGVEYQLGQKVPPLPALTQLAETAE